MVSRGQELHVEVRHSRGAFQAIVDSGAPRNYIDWNLVNQLEIQTKSIPSYELTEIGGQHLHTVDRTVELTTIV